jgi:hypothetical protein
VLGHQLARDLLVTQFEKDKPEIATTHHGAIEAFINAAPGWNAEAQALSELEWEKDNIRLLFDGLKKEAANIKAPQPGKAFISVRDPDKERVLPVAKYMLERGVSIVATSGTAEYLCANGVACERVNKVIEGRPHIVDLIKNGEICYIVNTTEGRAAIADSFSIRREALQQRVTYSTTVSGAKALLHSLDHRGAGDVLSLQELHKELA